MDTPTPRPTITSRAVRMRAAEMLNEPVADWLQKTVPGAKSSVSLPLTIAMLESADFYQAARYLDDECGFPVDGDLLDILRNAFQGLRNLVNAVEAEWVMETGIRVTAKLGDRVTFRDGTDTRAGDVVAVVRSRAVLYVRTAKSREHAETVPVPAEDILSVKPGKPAPSTTPFGGMRA